MKNEDLRKAFVPLSRQKIQQIGRLKPEQADIFPSFNQGQENRTDSSAPDAVPEPDIAGNNLQKKTETLQNMPTLTRTRIHFGMQTFPLWAGQFLNSRNGYINPY